MSSEYTVSRPYAKAAFEYAGSAGAYSAWSEMLETAALVIQDDTFARMLKDPRVLPQKKLDLLISIGGKVFNAQFINFLNVLSDNKRLSFMPYIYQHYEKLRSEAERVVHVELTSAFPLTDQYQEQFKNALKNRLKCEVALTCKQDNSILAGAVIRAGDLLIDGSLRGKIARLSDAMGVF